MLYVRDIAKGANEPRDNDMSFIFTASTDRGGIEISDATGRTLGTVAHEFMLYREDDQVEEINGALEANGWDATGATWSSGDLQNDAGGRYSQITGIVVPTSLNDTLRNADYLDYADLAREIGFTTDDMIALDQDGDMMMLAGDTYIVSPSRADLWRDQAAASHALEAEAL